MKNKSSETTSISSPKNWQNWLIYGILLALTFWVFSYIFDKKLALFGDPTDYYMLGKAIAQRDGYVGILNPEKSPANHFPPGYPFIISLIIRFLSDSTITVQFFNVFFLGGAVVLLFSLFRRMSNSVILAFIGAIGVLVNYHILQYSSMIMTETAYLFFSVLAIWFFSKSNLTKTAFRDPYFWAFVFTSAFCYYIRQTGLMLVAGAGLYLLIRKKWLHIGLMSVVFLLCLLPWQVRNDRLGGDSHLRDMQMINPLRPELGKVQGFSGWTDRFFTNTERYLSREIPSATLSTTIEDYTVPVSGSETFIGIFLLGLMAWGWYNLKAYRILIAGYAATTFALLLIYPDVWTGNRLMLHLVPFGVFCMLMGMNATVERILKTMGTKTIPWAAVAAGVVGILVLLPNVKTGMKQLHQYARITEYDPPFANYFQMAAWVKDNAPAGSMVICRKHSLFGVFSGSYASNYKSTENHKEFLDDLRLRSTDYVVIDALGYSSTPRYLVPVINANPDKFQIIMQLTQPDTYLCAFKDEFGWHGDYNEKGLPAGKGEYRFADGRKLVGTFTDARMNALTGSGTLFDAKEKSLGNVSFQNGQQR